MTKNKLRRAIAAALCLACLVLAVIGVGFGRDILMFIDTPPEILDSAELYLQILMGGVPLMLIYNFGSAILRSKGDTRRPLYAMMKNMMAQPTRAAKMIQSRLMIFLVRGLIAFALVFDEVFDAELFDVAIGIW